MGFAPDVREFITDMSAAYAGTDLVVCRAGATTLAELTVCKKPSILVPFPAAADNHQVVNAQSLVDAGAAVMIEERDLTGELLAAEIRRVLLDPASCASRMARAAGLLGRPQAASEIADVLTQLTVRRWGTPKGRPRGPGFRPVRPPPAGPDMTLFRSRSPRIHFVGIGGIGMSGIAELLLNLGYAGLRLGSQGRRRPPAASPAWAAASSSGHAAAHVGDADVVVISSAVRRDNPEVVEARRRKIPVIPRAEMLAELMRLKQGIAIAGSHGKTTTTSMAAHLMAHAGLDPTAVVGGKMNAFGSNAKLGKGDWIVVEADESDGSFLHYAPTLVVVTNVDPEHLDHWKTEEALKRGFVEFVNKVPFYGTAILCLDHPGVQSILPFVEKRFVTYGEAPQADYRATRVEVLGPRVAFEATRRGEPLGRFELAHGGAPQRAERARGGGAGRRAGGAGRGDPRGAGRPSRACSGASPSVESAAGSPWSTTTATTPPRSGPRCAAPARPTGGGWSASSSPTATPARATCSRSSRPPSTTPTCCSSPTSTPPPRSPSPASPAPRWPRGSAPAATRT